LRGRLAEVRRAFGWRKTLAAGFGVVLALAAVVQAGRLDKSVGRWSQIGNQLSNDARWLAAEAAMKGIPEAGWFGFGPGTFRVAFPYLTGYLGERLEGVWRFLHQDYLQTVLEWGYAGSALWVWLFAGAFIAAARSLRSARADEWTPRRKLLLRVVLLAVATVLLHAAVDFPLQIASIQLYVATYLGICWGSARWPRDM
jgi:O-antigen ligase